MVRNEQTKLLANALDRASTACFTVGIATPLAAWLYNIGNFRSVVPSLVVGFGIGGWFLVAVALHLLARRILRRLD
ncbi:hypothetical protein GEU84_003265 [Fertoebacter nigrum]|uniref:Uncharacterized protein n=1 Tax=Fertoeibacter niger TaxID=2656921 RepID=A0A8X8GWZ5_9RHOB|nr:hypothetical protein [Fertoeibacter niger]NUB43393.1 hypothetical protein [Fertoeibacter niger]